MALISTDGRLEQANRALGAICGRTRGELVKMRMRELVHPADADRATEALLALSDGATEQLAIELRIIPPVGSPLDISVNATRLKSGPEQAMHMLCQFQDVTDRKRYEEQLQFMSDHDPLTGLDNRRKFEADLDRHVEHSSATAARRAARTRHRPFRWICDTPGHSAGDQLLGSISILLRGRLRTSTSRVARRDRSWSCYLIEQRPGLQLEINISGSSLGDRKLLQAIDDRIRTSSIDPSRLIFEVTETAAVANITHAQAFA